MNFAWVIERDQSPPSAPEYYTGRNVAALRWSNPGDHAEACRFARREDAERVALSFDCARKHRIAEHGWEEPEINDARVAIEKAILEFAVAIAYMPDGESLSRAQDAQEALVGLRNRLAKCDSIPFPSADLTPEESREFLETLDEMEGRKP